MRPASSIALAALATLSIACGPDPEGLAVLDDDIALGQLHLAGAQALHLPALQGQAGLEALLDVIVVARLLVQGDGAAAAAGFAKTPRIVNLDPKTIFDVFDDLLKVGEAVDMKSQSEHAMVALRARYWEAVDFVNPYASQEEILFLEWADPAFVGGHWTPGLIEAAGGRHSLNQEGKPSRQVAAEDLIEVLPDRVIVCPCGFDLERSAAEIEVLEGTPWWPLLPAVQEGKIAIVDGSAMFNRPGPRLVDAFRWLVAWLQDRPEVLPEDFPVRFG